MDLQEKGYGFVRGEEVKYLVLFVLARVKEPVSHSELMELVMIDGGFDYFEFTDALASLKKTEHVEEISLEKYEITEKGRRNGAIMEDEIAYSVRKKSEAMLLDFNRKKLGARLNRTKLYKRKDEPGYTAEIIMDDVTGNMMTLSFFVANEKHGETLLQKFKHDPAQVYKDIVGYLLEEPKKEEETPC